MILIRHIREANHRLMNRNHFYLRPLYRTFQRLFSERIDPVQVQLDYDPTLCSFQSNST